jgi:hypothetical protein
MGAMIQMNKLLVFPLALMFLISVIIFMETSIEPLGTSPDMSSGDKIYINGSQTENANVTIPKAGTFSFNIWDNGLMAIMLIAIGVGIVAGIGILGSGLSDTAQGMIFASIFFIGLWVGLTVISSTIMLENMFTQVIWVGITLVYFVGLGTHISGGGSGD